MLGGGAWGQHYQHGLFEKQKGGMAGIRLAATERNDASVLTLGQKHRARVKFPADQAQRIHAEAHPSPSTPSTLTAGPLVKDGRDHSRSHPIHGIGQDDRRRRLASPAATAPCLSFQLPAAEAAGIGICGIRRCGV